MNLIHEIESALSHPMENGNYFPPLPGESTSSHRRRTQVLALHKLFRAHVPSAPLPTEKPTQTTRKEKHMTDTQTPESASAIDPASLQALLKQLKDTIKQLSGKGRVPKVRKVRVPGESSARTGGPILPGIGGIIRQFRYDKNLPQKKFAELTGLPPGAINHLEWKPKRTPDYTELQGVAKAMGITVGELVTKIESSLAG